MDNIVTYFLIFTINFIWITALAAFFGLKYIEFKARNDSVKELGKFIGSFYAVAAFMLLSNNNPNTAARAS